MGRTRGSVVGNLLRRTWLDIKDGWEILATLGSAGQGQGYCRTGLRTSLVAQWLRIHLPMQGTWVRALVQEDPTCHGAARPVCHNYWACALEPMSHNYWAHVPQLLSLCSRAHGSQLLKPTCLEAHALQEKPPQWEARAPQQRVAPTRRE